MPLKEMIIPPEAAGQRVSVFLRDALPDLPESVLRRIFSARDVKLDGVRVSREEAVRGGQVLKVWLPEAYAGTASPAASLSVVYEDGDVLLVNKRSGVSVEADARGGVTLTDLCADYVREKDPDAFPPAACHRLDNQTCGLCLFAKNPRALEILQDVFRDRTLEKYYECLVRGIMKPPAAVCRAWLVEPDARPIVTGYETMESGPVSRLRVHLVTGRTHQIRAHLAALGHPILGDDLYGDRDLNRREKVRTLRLCAVSLKLDTKGLLPQLDGREFSITPPF